MQYDKAINQFDNFLRNIDWQKHYNNLESWIKENASVIAEKLGVTKEWIMEHSEELNRECVALFKELSIEFTNGLTEIKSEWKKCIDAINTTFEKPEHLTKLSVEFLNMSKLSTVVREHIVPGSNAVAVLLKKTDSANIFYVCYLKDNEILPNKENNHVIILSQGIGRDIEQNFSKSSLIILK